MPAMRGQSHHRSDDGQGFYATWKRSVEPDRFETPPIGGVFIYQGEALLKKKRKTAAPEAPGFSALLLHRVLERLCGAELRGARGVDVNRLARAGITALARRARLGRKDSETGY